MAAHRPDEAYIGCRGEVDWPAFRSLGFNISEHAAIVGKARHIHHEFVHNPSLEHCFALAQRGQRPERHKWLIGEERQERLNQQVGLD
ncbi:MAG: hypothetical protein E5X60_14640 [Mesorhizobium sp.]|nr:MAG: hypothetical protein E5X60_14640 [Mesorhizobium sp.]